MHLKEGLEGWYEVPIAGLIARFAKLRTES